jgi:hypothetical protein
VVSKVKQIQNILAKKEENDGCEKYPILASPRTFIKSGI